MTSILYTGGVNSRNTFESIVPCSGQYSLLKDLRLNAWMMVTMAVYLIGLALLKHHPEWSVGVRCAIKLAPLPFILLYIRSWTRFVGRLDEFQRGVQISAFLFAGLGTALIGAILHTLSEQGLALGALPLGIGLGGFLFFMALLWPVGVMLAQCRYK